MNRNLGSKIWKSKLNPYYKRNRYIFFTLVICVIVLPILIFPIPLLAALPWGIFFYLLIYSIFSPIAILFLLIGFTFSRRYLVIYENGIKFRTKIFNPFSKKKILQFNQIKDINIDHIEPTNYKNKISKFLLYDIGSSPSLKTTGDYTMLSILTDSGKLYKIRESYISDSEKVKNLILKQKSVLAH